ncbi:MAG: hypothetical protein LBU37_14610 [Tannerellaceae bacterium]|jgi:hypothetical protein|nr:hypothetical protein [Tannerellaceae bacterium]
MGIEEKRRIAKEIFLYYAMKLKPAMDIKEQRELVKQIDAILDMYLDYLESKNNSACQ